MATQTEKPRDFLNEYQRLAKLDERKGSDIALLQRRGYDFEELLYQLLDYEGLKPRSGYRARSEQIDGSFLHDGKVHLLEAKWQSAPQPASSLYQFKGKVDGKLAGTIGMFVSMSGYSEDAVDALTVGKTLNTILFDRGDMELILMGKFTFGDAVRTKLRAAAETGTVFLPLHASSPRKSILQPIGGGEIVSRERDMASDPDLIIVCEGDTDRAVIDSLVTEIMRETGRAKTILIATAGGKLATPVLANAYSVIYRRTTKLLLVVDGDGDVEDTIAMLRSKLNSPWTLVVPDPGIEAWFRLAPLRRRRQNQIMGRSKAYTDKIKNFDTLRNELKTDASFQAFYTAVVAALE